MRTCLSTAVLLALFTAAPCRGFVSRTVGFRTVARSLEDRQLAPPCKATESSESVAVNDPSSTIEVAERRLELLDEATRSFNSSAASELISEITEMRKNKTEQAVIDEYLNHLLSEGPDSKLPLWTKLRIFSKFSKRARMASLRRTLDLTTPPPNVEDDEAQDDPEDQQRRRRRALVSLLRTLAAPCEDDKTVKGPAIAYIEKKACREQRTGGKSEDMTSRRPADLETPKYDVVNKRPAGYEIRRYDPFSVCSVEMGKPRPVDSYRTDATVSDPKMGGARAFGALAGYLFGKNQKEEAMKMTTPVLTNGQDGDKRMSFVLPSEFWEEDGLSLAPQPLDGSGVSLERNSGGERAVVMFGGYASKKEVEKRKQQLLDALAKDKEWAAKDEPVAIAQYNDPFTPPWKRLNEVSISVVSRKA